MQRAKLRSQSETVDQARALQGDLRGAIGLLPSDDPGVIDESDARLMARALAYDLVKKTYRLA